MKRNAAQISLPTDGDKEDARQHKHLPPPEKIRSFRVENLPPNGLGHGITSACFNLPADGIVDDLKQIICQELRLLLSKASFSTQTEWKPSAVLYQAQHHRQYDTVDI